MSKDYLIEHLDDITHIRLFRKVSLDTARLILEDLLKNYPFERRLWDLSQFTGDFTTEEIKDFAGNGDARLFDTGYVAMVAESDMLFGEMRQYKAYRELDNSSKVGVFRTVDDAVNWLKDY